MQVSVVQLFLILKEKVGEEKAMALSEYIEAEIKNRLVVISADSETNRKLDLLKLKSEFYLEINKRRIETIQLLFFTVIVSILISAMLVGFSR